LELSFGPRDRLYGVVGFGNPMVNHSRRPALFYGGVGLRALNGQRLELRGGLFRSGPPLLDDGGPRIDLAWYVPITQRLDLRSAFAWGGQSELDHEVGLGLAIRL
jgi:hypothetical protein